MSAYQCSETHIGALARKISELVPASDLSRFLTRTGTDDDLFRVLADENTKSLHARYPDIANDETAEWHDSVTQSKPLFHYPLLTDAEAWLAAHGYDYQACESDDYLDSSARRIFDALKEAIIGRNLTPEFVSERDAVKTWDIQDGFGKDREQGPVKLSQLIRAEGIEL